MIKIFQLLSVALCLINCSDDPVKDWVLDQRTKKDQMFKTSDESPLSDEDKGTFKGLLYFPYNPQYRVIATFKKVTGTDTVKMLTTKNEFKSFIYEGDMLFKLEGKIFNLKAFRATFYEADHYFVPFTDLTTGKETYETGRYLEIPFQNSNEYVIDFNRAYNPWCIYNLFKYNCPIPPDYNQLNIRIEAGELIYKKH